MPPVFAGHNESNPELERLKPTIPIHYIYSLCPLCVDLYSLQ